MTLADEVFCTHLKDLLNMVRQPHYVIRVTW
jgi:hypothetical protein